MKEILLNRKKGKTPYVAKIDDKNFFIVSPHKWWRATNGYVCSIINDKRIYLHRFIMKPQKKEMIDHINGDKFDNRKKILELVQ